MEETAQPSGKTTLPIILIAALVQGWGLFGLHHALDMHRWPATDSAWLIALYTIAIFVPLSVELLARHAATRTAWMIVAAVAAVFLYFGWHQGAVQLEVRNKWELIGDNFSFALPLTVLWLLMMPFVQGRLATGRWRVPYATLFANAWRNKLLLAEAGLFTGLFWLLLELWQTLFHMLAIDFFKELFEQPLFVYPVTAITFGIALHLIGSIDRLTSVVLEQLLNVLKWLAVVAGTLLAIFTIALALKLPGLVFMGERAIGAAWLLWLVAVIVLLLNAAFRDGSVDRPYPAWIATPLRFIVPLTVVISLTALYALIVRTQHYGITVERTWAFVVAGTAFIYSVGYSVAAWRPGPWMGQIARVNVQVALALMLVLSVILTPVMSPQRLSANSQFQMALRQAVASTEPRFRWNSPFHYLRFDAGTYGREKLLQLAALQNNPDAERIRRLAAAALAQENKWQDVSTTTPEEIRENLACVSIYPQSRTVDAALMDVVVADLLARRSVLPFPCSRDNAAGVFVDLNDDNSDEFVLLQQFGGPVFENRNGTWVRIGSLVTDANASSPLNLLDALTKGDFSAVSPKWKLLSVADHLYRVDPQR